MEGVEFDALPPFSRSCSILKFGVGTRDKQTIRRSEPESSLGGLDSTEDESKPSSGGSNSSVDAAEAWPSKSEPEEHVADGRSSQSSSEQHGDDSEKDEL